MLPETGTALAGSGVECAYYSFSHLPPLVVLERRSFADAQPVPIAGLVDRIVRTEGVPGARGTHTLSSGLRGRSGNAAYSGPSLLSDPPPPERLQNQLAAMGYRLLRRPRRRARLLQQPALSTARSA